MNCLKSRGNRAFPTMIGFAMVFTLFCGTPSAQQKEGPTLSETQQGQGAAPEWFVDRTLALGLDFQHRDGRSGERFYVETAASGGGFLDFDGDGDLDIYLINGAPTPGSPEGPAPGNALFENRDGRFVDVSEASGLDDPGYGMGFCIGDFDGDGLVDVFVTNFGLDRLFRNAGNGTFEDWTAKAGVGGEQWGTGCAFGDVDGDGDLDLYVANYVDFSFANNPQCGDASRGLAAYCRPTVFSGQRDFLYINQGDGRFLEEGASRGIDQSDDGKGFGSLISDVDLDGDADILVANDGTMNRFYRNRGDGVFEDVSLASGLGFNAAGMAESGMGMDLGDVNGDGLFDLVVTNYSFETNTMYHQSANGFWEDATILSGLSGPTYQPVGWGIGFFDADNDGDLDMSVANGHVMDNIALFEPHLSYPQANLLLLNQGDGRFIDATGRAGGAFLNKKVSRGLALGDVNNDGRLDLLVTNTNEQPDLLINQMPFSGSWIGFRLKGMAPNTLAIGAKLRVFDVNRTQIALREIRSGGSFLSQNDLRLHVGLGEYAGSLSIEVEWPDGTLQRVSNLEKNRYVEVVYEPQQ